MALNTSFVPLYVCSRFLSSCCLSEYERKIRDEGLSLFHAFNVEKVLCPCCFMEYLGNAETMLALKVLKEESRYSRSTHRFILTKLYEKLKEAGKEGGSINQAEFENAYSAAITESVIDLTKTVVRMSHIPRASLRNRPCPTWHEHTRLRGRC